MPESSTPELGSIQGSWQVLGTGEMSCWIPSSVDDESYAFSRATIDNWEPIQNTEGAYNVEFTQKTTACAEFDVQGVIITGILDENHEVIIETALLKRLQMSKLKQPENSRSNDYLGISSNNRWHSGPCWDCSHDKRILENSTLQRRAVVSWDYLVEQKKPRMAVTSVED